MSFLAQLVERVTSNDEVSRSSRLEGIFLYKFYLIFHPGLTPHVTTTHPYIPSFTRSFLSS